MPIINDYQHSREISAAVGKVLCLHGASSVKAADLPKLPEDGFVKINIFTTLAVKGGQAVATQVLENLKNIFTEEQLHDFIDQGILTPAFLTVDSSDLTPPRPVLNYVATPARRDVWFEAVKERCKEFLRVFNYANFA